MVLHALITRSVGHDCNQEDQRPLGACWQEKARSERNNRAEMLAADLTEFAPKPLSKWAAQSFAADLKHHGSSYLPASPRKVHGMSFAGSEILPTASPTGTSLWLEESNQPGQDATDWIFASLGHRLSAELAGDHVLRQPLVGLIEPADPGQLPRTPSGRSKRPRCTEQ